jgi:hypothetical protein
MRAGVVLHGVEADPVAVGIVQQGQDPATARRRAHRSDRRRRPPDHAAHRPLFAVAQQAAAETYLLITRMTRWDIGAYQDWLTTTFTRLCSNQ